MNDDDRLEEILESYLRGEAGEAELREIVRRLEAGDEGARRLAARISDDALLSGWFGSESDGAFVDEAAAAAGTRSDDPEFLARTLQRIERSESRGRRPARRRPAAPPGAGLSPLAIFTIAAGVAAVFALILTFSLSNHDPAPRPVVTAPKVHPVPTPVAPDPAPVIAPAPPVAPTPTPPTPLPLQPRAPDPAPVPPKPAPSPTPDPVTPPPPPAPRETIVAVGRLERIDGEVAAVGPDGRSIATAGADLYAGRGLETEKSGRALLRFPDGTTVDLGASTKVEEVVDRTPAAGVEGGKRIRLAAGTLTANVSKQPADRPFLISTPHGEARVVGTTLRLTVDEKGTRLDVTEGKVRLTRALDRKVADVVAGHFAVAAPGSDFVPRPIEGFTLRDIPVQGLALWLRADSGVTLAEGTVSSWSDPSAPKREAVQPDAAKRPVLVADAVRGRPALRFDGRDDVLTTPLSVEGLSGLTLVIVAANAVDAVGGANHGDSAALFWPETTMWGWVYLSPFQSNVKFRFGTTQPNNLPFHIRAASTAGAFTLTVAVKDGAVDSLYVQGVPVERFTGKLPAIKGTQPTLQIGLGSVTGYAGDIAEIFVYTRALGDADRMRLERALLGKYFGR